MDRPKAEWDPSWDDDWQAAQGSLQEEIEDEQPHRPAQAVTYYRYGFIQARERPTDEWSDVQAEMYQDYMTGAPEPGEPGSTNMAWEEASGWAHKGWQAARPFNG